MNIVLGIIAYLAIGLVAIRFRIWRPFTYPVLWMFKETGFGYRSYYFMRVKYYSLVCLGWPAYLVVAMMSLFAFVVLGIFGIIVEAGFFIFKVCASIEKKAHYYAELKLSPTRK